MVGLALGEVGTVEVRDGLESGEEWVALETVTGVGVGTPVPVVDNAAAEAERRFYRLAVP